MYMHVGVVGTFLLPDNISHYTGMVGLYWRSKTDQDRSVHVKIARGWFRKCDRSDADIDASISSAELKLLNVAPTNFTSCGHYFPL